MGERKFLRVCCRRFGQERGRVLQDGRIRARKIRKAGAPQRMRNQRRNARGPGAADDGTEGTLGLENLGTGGAFRGAAPPPSPPTGSYERMGAMHLTALPCGAGSPASHWSAGAVILAAGGGRLAVHGGWLAIRAPDQVTASGKAFPASQYGTVPSFCEAAASPDGAVRSPCGAVPSSCGATFSSSGAVGAVLATLYRWRRAL